MLPKCSKTQAFLNLLSKTCDFFLSHLSFLAGGEKKMSSNYYSLLLKDVKVKCKFTDAKTKAVVKPKIVQQQFMIELEAIKAPKSCKVGAWNGLLLIGLASNAGDEFNERTFQIAMNSDCEDMRSLFRNYLNGKFIAHIERAPVKRISL